MLNERYDGNHKVRMLNERYDGNHKVLKGLSLPQEFSSNITKSIEWGVFGETVTGS
jgi:hypothetical protein